MEQPEIEELGVPFQADDAATYMDSMMKRIVGQHGLSRPTSCPSA